MIAWFQIKRRSHDQMMNWSCYFMVGGETRTIRVLRFSGNRSDCFAILPSRRGEVGVFRPLTQTSSNETSTPLRSNQTSDFRRKNFYTPKICSLDSVVFVLDRNSERRNDVPWAETRPCKGVLITQGITSCILVHRCLKMWINKIFVNARFLGFLTPMCSGQSRGKLIFFKNEFIP